MTLKAPKNKSQIPNKFKTPIFNDQNEDEDLTLNSTSQNTLYDSESTKKQIPNSK